MKISMDFETRLREIFDQYFSSRPALLRDACAYALFGNGKRIRPTLCFLTADFCGIPQEKVVKLAAGIECIHNYSLIHDDLPGMDNDTYRRGQLTVHKKFGEAIAILAGDALLNVAYEIFFDLVKDDPSFIDSCKLIASYSGSHGMIGGQALEFVENDIDYDIYIEIAKKKTAGLISASILSVALLSHDQILISALSQFALYLGMIFQITDDLLDKNTGEKSSLVTILGEEKSVKNLLTFVEKAKKSLSSFGDKSQNLLAICNKIAIRTH